MMSSKLDAAIAFERQALNLRAYRQQVLGANIANADTPNYKARDFDFKSALDSAMAGKTDASLPLATTAKNHLPGMLQGGPTALKYRTETQSSVDGNTVDMDVERAAFADNAIHYEALVNFIGGTFRDMRLAIQGQNG